MRSFLTYGFISLATVASLYACGDDSGDDGGVAGSGGSTAGQGGTAGSGGNGGSGGAAGSTTNGGSGGNGGAGGAGPGPAPTANCTGCVQLSVQIPATPFTATGSQAGYIFSSVGANLEPFDLSSVTTITWRVQALTNAATYYVQPFVQNGPPEAPNFQFGAYPTSVPLTAADFAPGEWVDVALDVAALGGGVTADAGTDAGEVVEADAGDAGGGVTLLTAFDKSVVRQIGLNVGAQTTGPAGWVSVQVDSVTVAGTSNFTTKNFATDVEGLSLNMFEVPPGTLPPAFR